MDYMIEETRYMIEVMRYMNYEMRNLKSNALHTSKRITRWQLW